MIHEEICTYEVCKLAKEKGFNVPTLGNYRIDTEDWYRTDVYDDWNDSTIRYSAPTQSLLQRWLREEKKIVVVVDWFSIEQKYYWRVYDTSKDDMFASFMPSAKSMSRYDTWEQALESGLKYALKELK